MPSKGRPMKTRYKVKAGRRGSAYAAPGCLRPNFAAASKPGAAADALCRPRPAPSPPTREDRGPCGGPQSFPRRVGVAHMGHARPAPN